MLTRYIGPYNERVYGAGIDDFIRDQCIEGQHEEERAGVLYSAYCEWEEARGGKVASQTVFGRYLAHRGFEKIRASSGIYRFGLRLRERP